MPAGNFVSDCTAASLAVHKGTGSRMFSDKNQIKTVNSNTTGTITPMFSSYDWMKPNLKQKAGTAQGNGLFERTGESYEE